MEFWGPFLIFWALLTISTSLDHIATALGYVN